MLAVMYDKTSGIIRSVMRGAESTIALNGDYVEVPEAFPLPDYCNHYKVVEGKVVEKTDEEMAAVFVPPVSKTTTLDLSPAARVSADDASDDAAPTA